MRNRAYILLAVLMVIVDVGMVFLSLRLAYFLRFEAGFLPYIEFHPWRAYIDLAIVEVVLFPLLFALRGLYHPKRNVSRIDELQRVFTSVSIGTVLSWALSAFFARDFAFSRALTSFAWLLAVILIWLARMLQYWLRGILLNRGIAEDRVLIVGTGDMGKAIIEKIQQSPRLGYHAVGLVSEHYHPEAKGIKDVPLLGSLDDIDTLIKAHRISEVIIAEPSLSHRRILNIVARCERERVNIKVFPDVFQIISSEVSIGDLNGLPMVTVRDVALRGWRLVLKRAMDIIVSATVLIFFSPLMLLIALFIKLTSPKDPVFYTQERVGLDSKPFNVIKFRSMRPDAEEETGPVWAKRGDLRTTKLGRFLRRFSLDELPQFVNVLLGEMSVVGPRPERPHFVEQFSRWLPRYPERHREKAGLTGWAQVNGLRGNVSIEERTTYDLWYVENWNLWLDIKIILRTLIAIFRDENAY